MLARLDRVRHGGLRRLVVFAIETTAQPKKMVVFRRKQHMISTFSIVVRPKYCYSSWFRNQRESPPAEVAGLDVKVESRC